MGRINFAILCALLTGLSVLPPAASAQVPENGNPISGIVLAEAEAFADLGGWVVDQQFMDQMGSPFLLAHGLGKPVADARTTITFPAAGRYRVWVRTRDWVAGWGAPGTPGRFEVLLRGKKLDPVFGTVGAEWHWQDGARVDVPAGEASLVLHDLTGFEGRCDAILFVRDARFTPPNRDPGMADFRREALGLSADPEDAGEFDLVVVGGGIAGICAAVGAARLGVSVALIQDRPVLGGNNSSEVRVWLGGTTNHAPFPRVGSLVCELDQRRRGHPGTSEMYEDDRKTAVAATEKKLVVFPRYRANRVEMSRNRIRAVIAQHIIDGRRKRFRGRWFADCTGDGCIGFLAGADYDLTREGHMGRCNLWSVEETESPVAFPRCPWALDLSHSPFPSDLGRLGKWFWESGFDHAPIEDGEAIRDWNFRAMYGAWDCLKNVRRKYPNHRLAWAAYISGKRESRRLLGDVVLTKKDLIGGKAYPDGCVPTSWSIDVHVPDPRYERGFEGDAFISKAIFTQYRRPYWVPYRCLYSRNVSNLFMAGRDISVTHEALGTVRVMRTTGMMGEIVAMAAAVCLEYGIDPRAVYEQQLEELKMRMRKGVGKPINIPGAAPPPWIDRAGPSLALTATVTVSGSLDAGKNPPSRVNDGLIDLRNNGLRWLSDRKTPNWIEFAWPEPWTINAARIVSGYFEHGRTVSAPIADFAFEVHDEHGWKPIRGTTVRGNSRIDWHAAFSPVTVRRMRLLIRRTPGNIARIWEVSLFALPPE